MRPPCKGCDMFFQVPFVLISSQEVLTGKNLLNCKPWENEKAAPNLNVLSEFCEGATGTKVHIHLAMLSAQKQRSLQWDCSKAYLFCMHGKGMY